MEEIVLGTEEVSGNYGGKKWVRVEIGCLVGCSASAGSWQFKLMLCRLTVICSDQHLTGVCYKPVSCFIITDCCVPAQWEIKSAQ